MSGRQVCVVLYLDYYSCIGIGVDSFDVLTTIAYTTRALEVVFIQNREIAYRNHDLLLDLLQVRLVCSRW